MNAANPTTMRAPETDELEGLETEPSSFPAVAGRWRIIDRFALAALAIPALVLRFWTRSPMWLDEALTAHIASLPIGQIPGALRHDGHPPLYYVLVHLWTQVFGTSDLAFRSLAGIFGVALLPVAWLVGRRVGGRSVAWCTVVLVAILPYALRYSTENRMYSLVMLLALVGYLLVDSALRRPRLLTLAGIVLVTSALLWTHYWAMWLGLTAAACVAVRWARSRRAGNATEARAAGAVLVALVLGALTFIPWLGTLAFQSAHTGTPWATRSLPPSVLVSSVQDLGGAVNATDAIGGWVVTLIVLIGLFATKSNSARVLLDLRTQPRARRMAWLCLGTMAVGSFVMLATNSAFQSRYNAVWLPFAFVIGGMGLALVRGPVVQRAVLAVVVLSCAPGAVNNVILARSQSRDAAAAIVQYGRPGDVVALCPDQLGPSLVRELPAGFQVGSYPTFSDPGTVDWVDYTARTNAATPEEFAQNLLDRAGGRNIFLVWMGNYETHKGLCEKVVGLLQKARPGVTYRVTANRANYESENVMQFAANTGGP